MRRDTATLAPRIIRAVMAVLFLLPILLILAPAKPADALSLDSVTASRNQSGGNDIIGGKSTRLSWEGTVGSDEKVMQITVQFPDGTVLADDASLTLQEMIMDDPMHPVHDKSVKYTYDLTDTSLVVKFADGLRPNNKLIIQIEGFQFPNATGDYDFPSSYIDDKGTSHVLASPRPVSVIGVTKLEDFLDWLGNQKWVQAWNSVKFFNYFLNPVRAIATIPALVGGWLTSLSLVFIGFPLAIPVGLGISFLRMSRYRILKFLSSIYVNVIRGTPLFLQIYIAFLGLPLFIPNTNNFVTSFIVLALNSSAYLAEIFRAGIQSINKGQFEAASSLGMNGFQTMFSVIIPQTVRRVIPTMTSEFILLFKDTSLLASVGVFEMMLFAKTQSNLTGNITPYMVAAGFYLVVTLPLTRVISVFEKKLAATDGKEAPPTNKKQKPKMKRVGLFKTIAPLSATDSDPDVAISPEEHMA